MIQITLLVFWSVLRGLEIKIKCIIPMLVIMIKKLLNLLFNLLLNYPQKISSKWKEMLQYCWNCQISIRRNHLILSFNFLCFKYIHFVILFNFFLIELHWSSSNIIVLWLKCCSVIGLHIITNYLVSFDISKFGQNYCWYVNTNEDFLSTPFQHDSGVSAVFRLNQ